MFEYEASDGGLETEDSVVLILICILQWSEFGKDLLLSLCSLLHLTNNPSYSQHFGKRVGVVSLALLVKKCCIICALDGIEFDILRDNSDLNCPDLRGDFEDADVKCQTGHTSEEDSG